jgi:stage II sporulation protein D
VTVSRAAVAWLAVAATLTGSAGHAQPAGTPAWAIVEWPSGAVVAGAELGRLREPAQPGSILKIATLVAALESGLVTPDTRVPCAGEARIDGELVRCSHPRMRHPPRPAEALALSCNVWFATIGARLSRSRLDATLVALGLPPSPRRAPMPLAATGLRAAASPPLAWVEALRRLLDDPPAVPMTAGARALLLDGLRGAALYGSAAAFSDRGMDALAKTGTADQRAGGVLGAVIAAWPSVRPTRGIVLVGAGIAGRDAADLAARLASSNAPVSAAAAPSVPTPTPPRSPASSGETTFRVGYPGKGRADIRTLEIEDYVARVLAGEAAPRSPEAALDALAITARTFALHNRGRHAREGFDLCTLTHCQVLREPYPAGHAAAERTRGQRLLTTAGGTADVYYAASCGGRTETPSAVWTRATDPAYLPSRIDRACDGEPRWAAEIPVRDLERALRSAGYRGGALRDLEVEARSGSGRATVIALDGFVPSTISGQDFRMLVGRTLGWHLLKSTAFDLRRTGGGYRFDGRGFGHGIGLCVLGSVNRASRGADTRTILEQYFPGLVISAGSATRTSAAPVLPHRDAPAPRTATPRPAPSGTVMLSLPSASEPERTAFTAFLAQALGELSRAIGVSTSGQLRVVVHPSADSFRRETREPWWSAARTRGTRIDLLPLPVLRSRGTVDGVVKHELVHVLTDTRLAGRPLWVREGVAMHFAGERPPASLLDGDVPRRVKCPSDDELSRAVSAAAAREAYARAAACVARAIAEGREWHAIP